MSVQIDIYLCGCSLMVEPEPSKLATGVRFSSSAPVTFLFELLCLNLTYNQSVRIDFFVFRTPVGLEIHRNHPKERMVLIMIKFTTQELEMEKSLKQRIEFICEFCHVTPIITNGSIKRINNTNLNYIEPHKIVVNNTTFLAFNYSTDIYIGNLNKKIKLVELEDYIKNMA